MPPVPGFSVPSRNDNGFVTGPFDRVFFFVSPRSAFAIRKSYYRFRGMLRRQ